jgi:hypothetical protein
MATQDQHRVYETMTPEQRIERARNAGKAGHTDEYAAMRLVRHWPNLSAHQQDVIRTIIRPLVTGGGDDR